MANCEGSIAISTKVDEEMQEFIESAAEENGVSRAELLRRLLDHYRDGRDGYECPACNQSLKITL